MSGDVIELRVARCEADVLDHEQRIRALERAYWKLIGASAAFAGIGGALGALIGRLM